MNEFVTDVKTVKLPDDFVEQILKQYRRITWECKTAKDIGNSYKISMDFLPLLKDVFFQDNELRSSNNISLEYVLLTQIKKIMDTGIKKLKEFPDNGFPMYRVLYHLFLCDSEGKKVSGLKAHEAYLNEASSLGLDEISYSTFKNYRLDGIKLLNTLILAKYQKYFNTIYSKSKDNSQKNTIENSPPDYKIAM